MIPLRNLCVLLAAELAAASTSSLLATTVPIVLGLCGTDGGSEK